MRDMKYGNFEIFLVINKYAVSMFQSLQKLTMVILIYRIILSFSLISYQGCTIVVVKKLYTTSHKIK